MSKVAEFQTALANSVGGVGRAQELTVKGITLPADFARFRVQFKGQGASTAFDRTNSGKWEIEGVINLPALSAQAELTETFQDQCRGFLVHEQLHVHLTDFDKFQEIQDRAKVVHRE